LGKFSLPGRFQNLFQLLRAGCGAVLRDRPLARAPAELLELVVRHAQRADRIIGVARQQNFSLRLEKIL
jgi:hypothetical protein